MSTHVGHRAPADERPLDIHNGTSAHLAGRSPCDIQLHGVPSVFALPDTGQVESSPCRA
ncbi:hypothetical protein CT19425_U300009 [Cupriavidus taiwanensis]|uniref:Uncharacterized protein n=1 Tax=Cupriavidus taiwanensis TaxID=164546 RepID=A0A375HGP0_9BURK|nr:hypothetical protein CBM2588_B150013 [Cupriavidus taiwanensis]SOY64930.1 hypothetical protein CBM2592_B120014 [Cupriavidus taiwanensis]SOY94086.1 hypothetical protein CBM2591_B110012 [Cupriavidus taiwanensis]SOZ27250.1 hypothetical protein CBM2608_B110010 [Cupriavidus taiwanensis]SOZ69291.1 hypothetical protein CBM2617_B150013 [Cupriavidus taiwanensis]